MINNKVGIKYVLLLFCGGVLLSGCTSSVSLSHKPRLLHFSTPEVSGGWGSGTIEAHASTKEDKYEFGSVNKNATASENLISSSETEVADIGVSMKVGGWIGLHDIVDFYWDTERVLGAKVQLFGEPRLKGNGFKVALAIQGGTSISKENTAGFILAVGETEASTTTRTKISDISINMGYRYSPNALVYVNTFVNDNKFTGTLSYGPHGIFNQAKVSSRSYGSLLGASFSTNKKGFLTLEVGAAQTNWDGLETTRSYPVGASIGYIW